MFFLLLHILLLFLCQNIGAVWQAGFKITSFCIFDFLYFGKLRIKMYPGSFDVFLRRSLYFMFDVFSRESWWVRLSKINSVFHFISFFASLSVWCIFFAVRSLTLLTRLELGNNPNFVFSYFCSLFLLRSPFVLS